MAAKRAATQLTMADDEPVIIESSNEDVAQQDVSGEREAVRFASQWRAEFDEFSAGLAQAERLTDADRERLDRLSETAGKVRYFPTSGYLANRLELRAWGQFENQANRYFSTLNSKLQVPMTNGFQAEADPLEVPAIRRSLFQVSRSVLSLLDEAVATVNRLEQSDRSSLEQRVRVIETLHRSPILAAALACWWEIFQNNQAAVAETADESIAPQDRELHYDAHSLEDVGTVINRVARSSFNLTIDTDRHELGPALVEYRRRQGQLTAA